ncbi:MAG TPA: D-alanyl-D-alanine carboxypeptidase, partial [bacterium]|nr:D-alanyl-D-alanine carboxypeptidase [bacterium]
MTALERTGCSSRPQPCRRAALALLALWLGTGCALASSGAAPAAPAPPLDLQGTAESLAGQAGLAPTEWALLLYSTAQERALVSWRAEAAMIAASNAKLATSYAALRTLGPNHRWRTRFFLIATHDGAAGTVRQGLLVQGGADPTLTLADLDEVARRLRADGIVALPLGLFLDGSRFPGPRVPGARPPVPDLEVSALAQEPSAFIVNHNAVDVQVAWRAGHAPVVLADLPPGLVTVLPRLQQQPQGRTALHARQAWSEGRLTLELTGTLGPGRHHLAVPVVRTEPWFARALVRALERQAITGTWEVHAWPPAGA